MKPPSLAQALQPPSLLEALYPPHQPGTKTYTNYASRLPVPAPKLPDTEKLVSTVKWAIPFFALRGLF
jgi:hypothetical protein